MKIDKFHTAFLLFINANPYIWRYNIYILNMKYRQALDHPW